MMPPKKSGLSLMIAMGKPKSSDDEMAQSPEQTSDESTTDDSGEDGEDMLDLPKGFKPPSSSADGGVFTTTIRGMIIQTPSGPKLKVAAVGDMPIRGDMPDSDADETPEDSTAPADEAPDQSQQPALDSEYGAYAKRKKDQMAAQKAFQPSK